GRLADSGMLTGADDNGIGRKALGAAYNGLSDRLGCRAGEHHLLTLGACQTGNVCPGTVDQMAQGAAMSMDRGWIAHEIKRSHQRRPRFWQKRGRGIMIKI